MSNPALRLWQRLKQLLTTASADPHPKTPVNPATALSLRTDTGNLSNLDTLDTLDATTKGTTPKAPALAPVNAAFDDTAFADTELGGVGDTGDAAAARRLDISAMSEAEADLISAHEIESLLEAMGYHFVYHPVREGDEQHIHHFTMQVSDKTHEWGCMIRYFGEQQLIAAYSVLPFQVAESHRAEMLAVITYLNYDLMIGNLEMDLADGELRFKTSLDLEVTGVNELVLSYLLQSNFSLISRLYDTLEDVVKQHRPIDSIQEAVDRLLASEQSKAFFLMSEAVQ